MKAHLATTAFLLCSAASAQTVTVNPGGPHAPWTPGFVMDTRLTIDLNGSFTELSLDSVGDLTGDTRRELAVGIPELDQVRILNGRSGNLLYTIQGPIGSSFGFDVAGTDLDGDGIPDLIVGAPDGGPMGNGQVEVYQLGALSGTNLFGPWGSQADLLLPDPHCGADSMRYGDAVAAAADYDGDGILEVLVGAPEFSRSGGLAGCNKLRIGLAEVVNVTALGVPMISRVNVWVGFDSDDRLGESVALFDDATGDGMPEVAVGEPRFVPGGAPSPSAGACRIFNVVTPLSSPPVFTLQDPSNMFPTVEDMFGFSLANLGDLDPDPLNNAQHLAVGAPVLLDLQPGHVDVYSLPTLLTPVSSQGNGPISREYGAAVSGLAVGASNGDINGDGFGDYLVGEPCISSCSSNGRAYVVSGLDGSILAGVASSAPTSSFGSDLTEMNFSQGLLTFAVSDPMAGMIDIF